MMSEDSKNHKVESFEDPLQHLWAISYADLLMVVLAFFVVYDVSPNKENIETKVSAKGVASIIDKLQDKFFRPAGSKKEAASQIASDGLSTSSGEVSVANDKEALEVNKTYDDVKNLLGKHSSEALQVTYNDSGHEILILFGDEYFRPGEYLPSPALRKKLEDLSRELNPFSSEFLLEVIGHADPRPVSRRLIEKGIKSNLVLSALRAAEASDVMINNGYASEHVVISGHGEKGQKVRTLTMKVKEIAHLKEEGFRK